VGGARLPRPLRWPSTAVLAISLLATSVLAANPATAAVPGPPTNVTARAGDQLAEATWDAPIPADPSITGYTITASPAETPAVTVDHTARTATVTGLSNGTAYSFSVTAANADGTSPPSAPSAPVIPAPPTATTITRAATPTSVLHGGSVALSGRLQQVDTAAGIAGETVIIERRPKGTTTWPTLATVTTASDATLDPTPQSLPRSTPTTGCATQHGPRVRSRPVADAKRAPRSSATRDRIGRPGSARPITAPVSNPLPQGQSRRDGPVRRQ
jgi:hypothetical protein